MIENSHQGSFFTDTDVKEEIEYPKDTGERDVAVPSLVEHDGKPHGFSKVFLQGQVYDQEAMPNVLFQADQDMEKIEGKEEKVA